MENALKLLPAASLSLETSAVASVPITIGDPSLARIIEILRETREEFELSFGADGCLNRHIDAARSII